MFTTKFRVPSLTVSYFHSLEQINFVMNFSDSQKYVKYVINFTNYITYDYIIIITDMTER